MTNGHFESGRCQPLWVGLMYKTYSKHLFGWVMKPNVMQSKMNIYVMYIINIPMVPWIQMKKIQIMLNSI